MGKKTSARKIQTVVLALAALAATQGLCSLAFAVDLPLRAVYEQSGDPLTTEKIWALAPEELNPHRLSWILTRQVEFSGLRTELSHNTYQPVIDALVSKEVSYIRGVSDPHYSTIQSFPCTEAPQAWFSTLEGTRFAADLAGKKWEELLGKEKFELAISLTHVHGEFSENAVRDSKAKLDQWLKRVNTIWQEKTLPAIRAQEWAYYRHQAAEARICTANRGEARASKAWSSLMEAPKIEKSPKLIAHLPAKRWGGLYSVLVTLKIGAKSLVGKFLIDSGAPQSVISPTFLSNQGAHPSWVEVPRAHPQRVVWSGGEGVGTPAYISEADVSGVALPLHDFLLTETDFFGPPESFGTCCDGVLGSDFLRNYAVEFKPGKMAEVNLYERSSFGQPEKTPWVEVSFNPRKEIVSDCTVRPEARGEQSDVLSGVIWQTGIEDALEFNRSASPKERAVSSWKMSCGDLPIADHIQISSKDQAMTGKPPLDAGMDLMGRGDFIFDLPHGRLWFNPNGLLLPLVQDHSGLNLEYTFIDGDRRLVVVGIRRGSPAWTLHKAGLRPGMSILSINTKPVDDMDTWEVEQRLSGIYGSNVTIEWKTGKRSSKVAPLKLPPITSLGLTSGNP